MGTALPSFAAFLVLLLPSTSSTRMLVPWHVSRTLLLWQLESTQAGQHSARAFAAIIPRG